MLVGKGLLTPAQQACLALFAELPDQEQFYLTGGTALAEFYLGHRLSSDLDLFTAQEPLIAPFAYQFEASARQHGMEVSVVRRFATYVEFLVGQGGQGTRVDLALDSPFRFAEPVSTPSGVRVNSWRDLSVDKLLAYYGRAEPRDAVDLHFIMQHEPVDELLALAGEKDGGFDLYWMAVALNRAAGFPDELDRWPVKVLLPFEPEVVKRQFLELALAIMSKTTGAP